MKYLKCRNRESREQFLANFEWAETTLMSDGRKKIEETLVEYKDIMARHRFDIGVNQHFKIKTN